MTGAESWVNEVLEPMRRNCFVNLSLKLETQPCAASFCVLSGVHQGERWVDRVDKDERE